MVCGLIEPGRGTSYLMKYEEGIGFWVSDLHKCFYTLLPTKGIWPIQPMLSPIYDLFAKTEGT